MLSKVRLPVGRPQNSEFSSGCVRGAKESPAVISYQLLGTIGSAGEQAATRRTGQDGRRVEGGRGASQRSGGRSSGESHKGHEMK